MFLKRQIRILLQQSAGRLRSRMKFLLIRINIAQLEHKRTALPLPEQFSRPAKLQVLRRDLKAVVGTIQNLETLGKGLFIRVIQEYTVRLALPRPTRPRS